MADHSTEGDTRLRFREDILRGVRLFAIAFAAILFCVAAYRMLRLPADVQGAPPEDPAASETAQPTPEPSPNGAPVVDAASETHPLVVPEPPPVGGKPIRSHLRTAGASDVPPPPPAASSVARAHRAPVPAGREFESSNAIPIPVAPAEETTESKPMTPQQKVGYRSLLDANTSHPPVEYTPPDAATEDPVDTPAKGNRFFRAVGRIFHPGAKKEADPSALQPKQP